MLQYGRDGLEIDVPFQDVTVLRPQFVPGLPDEKAAFTAAVRQPGTYWFRSAFESQRAAPTRVKPRPSL